MPLVFSSKSHGAILPWVMLAVPRTHATLETISSHDERDGFPLFFAWRSVDIINKTLECTTQLAKSFLRYPMRRHCKDRNPFSNVMRLDETVSTDPIFANCPSLFHRWNCAQIFVV